MEKQKASLDYLLNKFSIFGRYHFTFMCYLCFVFAINSLHTKNYIFAAEEVGYRCKDENFGNNTCTSENDRWCSEWIYDNPNSFMAEFDLACHEWKRTLVGTIHSFGYMVGLLFVGPISDRFGRKKITILTSLLGGVFGLAKSYTYSYWLYIMLEFLESAAGDSSSPAFVLSLEIVSAKKRVRYQSFCNLGFVIGEMFSPFAAWGIPYWRHFLRTIYSLALLFISYFFLIDESPRWLLSKGKKEEVVSILKKIGKANKIKLDQDELHNLLVEDEDKGVTIVNLMIMTFQSRVLLKRFLVCIVWWTTATFVNYGMMINSVSLQGNKYINYALVTAIEIPGNFVTMYILIHFKRRNPLICSFFACAVLCVIQPFLPHGYPWFSVMMYMASKYMTSLYFNITYLYTSELFPTYTRNSMHALCSSIGRIGSILAPQTPLLMVYWSGIPSVIFGGVSFIAGLVTFLGPDISNDSLPDTVQEAENLGKKVLHKMVAQDNQAMSRETINLENSKTT